MFQGIPISKVSAKNSEADHNYLITLSLATDIDMVWPKQMIFAGEDQVVQ